MYSSTSTGAMNNLSGVILVSTACLCVVQVLAADTANSVYGPNCISCNGARDPADCQDTIQCWASQQCYTESYVHADGHVLYDFGCKIKDECTLIEQNRDRKKRLDITVDLCEECCHGEMCNANTCVNRTEAALMECYACESESNPKDCHILQLCNTEEICYAEKIITDRLHPVFTLGCVSRHICEFLESDLQSIVGRSLGMSRNKRVTHLCQKCCSTPGCNSELCTSEEVTRTQAFTSGSTTSPHPQYSTNTSTTPLTSTVTPSSSSPSYVTNVAASECMQGAVYFNDSCYVMNPTVKVNSYDDALTECQKLNSTLVSVDSVEERDFLVNYLKNTKASNTEWLTDAQFINGGWVWADSGIPINMATIGLGPGTSAKNPCLSIHGQLQFHFAVVYCRGFPRNFICEKQAE